MVCSNSQDGGVVLDLIERERPNTTNVYYPAVNWLAEHPSYAGRDLSFMRRGNLYPILTPDARPPDPSFRHDLYGMSEVGSAGELTVLGDAVNVASRLQQSAEPDAILVADATMQLVANIFTTDAPRQITLKGKSEPVAVRALLGMKPRLFFSSPRGVEGVRTHLIGREAELQALQDRLSAVAEANHPQLVLLSGEAGVGKSRLLMELLRDWDEDEPLQLMRGRMEPRWQSIPYALLRDVFTLLCNIADADTAADVQQKLLHAMTALLESDPTLVVDAAVPIGQLIGLQLPQDPMAETDAQQIEQAEAQLLRFFQQVGGERPLVLLLEDLHWADEASLAFVERLLATSAECKLLIIGTTRPALFERQPTWCQTVDAQTTRLPLNPLSPEQSCELVTDILRYVTDLPSQLVQLIVDTAEGNPFYVEELVKVLIEDGVIVPAESHWTVSTHQMGQMRVPASLTGVIQARMDRLTGSERVVLQRASVFGRQFAESAVLHLTATDVRPISAEESRRALQTLQRREILYRVPSTQLDEEPIFAFKHIIFREVAYESVLLRERPTYHREAANVLVAQSGERLAEHASVIAEHFELAEENERSAEMFEIAGNRALERHQLTIAMGYFEKVLDLLADRTLPLAGLLNVRAQLGDLQWRRGRLADAKETLLALRDAAEVDGDLVWQANAWNALAKLALEQANSAEAEHASREAERLAWLVGNNVELLEAQMTRSRALQHSDRETAVAQAEQAWTTSRKLGGVLEIGRCLALLVSLTANDESLAALDYVARLGTVVRRDLHSTKVSPQSVVLYCLLGEAHADLGDQTYAAHHLSLAQELSQLFDDRLLSAETAACCGHVALRFKEWTTAVHQYRAALTALEPLEERLKQLACQVRLAEATAGMGNSAEAQRLLEPVLAAAEDGLLQDWRLWSVVERFCGGLPDAAE